MLEVQKERTLETTESEEEESQVKLMRYSYSKGGEKAGRRRDGGRTLTVFVLVVTAIRTMEQTKRTP